MSRRKVLVVEDDAAIRRGVADALAFAGYDVAEAADGKQGLADALALDVELVLLDVLMPGLDGFAVLTELRRAKPALPVIMLTAKGTEQDRVRGLTGGADDYVVKPFSARELIARVEAVLRRSAERPKSVGTLDTAGRKVDFERREVTLADGRRSQLSEREADVLHYLAACAGRVVSRDELLQRVWGLDPEGVATRTVDVHVARIREKLGDDAESPRVVVTLRGAGYRLAVDA